jgi:hypothetical protein
MTVPMKHNPLGGSRDTVMTFVQCRQASQDRIVVIRHIQLRADLEIGLDSNFGLLNSRERMKSCLWLVTVFCGHVMMANTVPIGIQNHG